MNFPFGKLTPPASVTEPLQEWEKGARHKLHCLTVGLFHAVYIYLRLKNHSLVVELSDNCKKVQCNICEALHGQNNGWIQKESLTYHLKLDVHSCSVCALQDRDTFWTMGEQSLREESTIEESMDFAMLSSAIEPAVVTKAPVSKSSMEGQEMWNESAFFNKIFSAGIKHTATAAEERKQVEKEATDFDLWHSADFLPEEDPNNSKLLLDKLEQDNILIKLLRNAHLYTSQFCSYISIHLMLWIGPNAPEGADILDKEVQGCTSRSNTSEAWSPYAFKTVSQPFNTDQQLLNMLSIPCI